MKCKSDEISHLTFNASQTCPSAFRAAQDAVETLDSWGSWKNRLPAPIRVQQRQGLNGASAWTNEKLHSWGGRTPRQPSGFWSKSPDSDKCWTIGLFSDIRENDGRRSAAELSSFSPFKITLVTIKHTNYQWQTTKLTNLPAIYTLHYPTN